VTGRLDEFQKQSANVISGLRLALACVWVVVFCRNPTPSETLLLIALGAAASDFFDGRIARFMQSEGLFGRWLDGVADVVFILAALCCEVYAGAIPVYVPALIAASFAQYALDSLLIRGSAVPVKSRLGHWAGVFNYVMVILLAWAPPPRLAGVVLRDCSPLIAVLYLAAIYERTLAYGLFSGSFAND
jgi:phosphatidylglycerophosphate synthase